MQGISLTVIYDHSNKSAKRQEITGFLSVSLHVSNVSRNSVLAATNSLFLFLKQILQAPVADRARKLTFSVRPLPSKPKEKYPHNFYRNWQSMSHELTGQRKKASHGREVLE